MDEPGNKDLHRDTFGNVGNNLDHEVSFNNVYIDEVSVLDLARQRIFELQKSGPSQLRLDLLRFEGLFCSTKQERAVKG